MHLPDSGKLLTHHHHIFSKADTSCALRKSGIVAYLGGVHTTCVNTAIKLLHVTNKTSTIHINNATYTGLRVNLSADSFRTLVTVYLLIFELQFILSFLGGEGPT